MQPYPELAVASLNFMHLAHSATGTAQARTLPILSKDAFVGPATCKNNKEIFASFSAAAGSNKMAPDG